MDRIDAAVIGAGVVGLAVARALAQSGRSVVILERESQIGTGISSRSSEVIHAGLYYPAGSLKERLCLAGKRMLYAYCQSRHVPHRRCSKLIFAADEHERMPLQEIANRGAAAGVDDLLWLERHDAQAMEPALVCSAALLSPSTGIVDSHALMISLLGEAEDHGAVLARKAPAERIERRGRTWRVWAGGTTLECGLVVNAAGLGAQEVAKRTDGLSAAAIPPLHLAKGSYFAYGGKVPFSRLIYPVPVPGGLGTHLTFDMAGQARFGPDMEWIWAPDHAVEPARKPQFVSAALKIWTELDPDRLVPAYAGIRPKLSGPGEPAADFVIQSERHHGLEGLVNLFGIESPGLTAALAIGDEVSMLARDG